jgi:CRP/FNR family transcriptional regulator, cyclic AMP receptor protein
MNKSSRATVPVHVAAAELFAACSRGELELIERLATLTDVKRGSELCRQGEMGQTFFVVVKGEATVSVDGAEFARLGPGCGFGEVALLTPRGRRIATVTAATPMTLIVFSRPEFATLMVEVPRVARGVLQESRRRLRQTTGHVPVTATS